MKKVLSLSWVLFVLTFNQNRITDEKTELNKIAVNYVKLGLTIGQYDPDFVTTYYGPDSLKSTKPISAIFPKDSLLHEVEKLRDELKIIETSATDTNLTRARWMSDQLLAYSRRVKNFSGDFTTFDAESKELFGVVAPVCSKEYYKNLVAYLDKLLPGRGTVRDRFTKLSRRFIIPKNKLDTIF